MTNIINKSDSWIEMNVSDIIRKISTNRKKIKQKKYLKNGFLPIIDQGSNYIGGYTNDFSKKMDCELPVIVFGDHTKAIKFVNFNFAPGADGVKVIKPISFYNPKLFEFFLKVLINQIPDKGYARHFQYIEKTRIPLPPLPEQHRIVAKIEELFSELDNGIGNLKKALEQLKIYRQAVLKYAFEGKLTNQVENNELPKRWNIRKLGESLDIVSGSTPKGINDIQSSGKIPFYKVGDMNTHGNEVYMKKANLNLTQEDLNSLKVKLFPKGTVIFPKRGGAILTNKKRILSSFSGFDLNLMGAIPNENIDGLYLYYWFQKLNLSKIYDGSNVPQINKKNIAPLDIPIPPINEQYAIVQEIESRLSVCDKIEQTIEGSLKKAEAMRQSILKKAFSGELTGDWREKHPELITGENSAEKLLEKIRAEKAMFAAGLKKPRSKKMKLKKIKIETAK